MAERIELDDLGERPEQQPEDQQEETNVDDESILVPDGSNPDFLGERQGWDIDIETSYTKQKEDLLKEATGKEIYKEDNPALFARLKLTKKGAKFDNVDMIVFRGKKAQVTKDKRYAAKRAKFEEQIRIAEERHAKTGGGYVEEQLTDVPPSKDLTHSILRDSVESLENFIDEKEEEIRQRLKTAEQSAQTEQEIISYRELRDLLMDIPGMNDENLENGGLETQKNYLKEIAENSSERKAALCRQIIKLCELKEDEIRLRMNQRPETEEVQNIVKDEIQNSTLRRFQKFKEWTKKNLAGLSVVVISVAGIVTTIVMGAKNAIKRGASATGKFAKALAKVAEKAVPVIGALLNLASKLLTLGAKGINFLSNNLWLLAVAITYALYEKRKKHTK